MHGAQGAADGAPRVALAARNGRRKGSYDFCLAEKVNLAPFFRPLSSNLAPFVRCLLPAPASPRRKQGTATCRRLRNDALSGGAIVLTARSEPWQCMRECCCA